ncbi:hypothetical protein ACVIW2_006663 [Bradyrhizobium huanghuaihaiense]|uniref:Uncharacterized protein n=1 Tax=Bradyrhizobium huanghuaihaiense TaxID=990078 RepID=A0A562RCE0_9BRAD|nr:hypothetical protein IQ16_04894 [Bradyrhizobium huanghuaihaiense]
MTLSLSVSRTRCGAKCRSAEPGPTYPQPTLWPLWVPALRSNATRCSASGTRIYPNRHSAVSTTRSMNARTLAESRREVG